MKTIRLIMKSRRTYKREKGLESSILRKRIRSGIELKRRNPKDMGSKYQLSKSDSDK
jgi:hypothetical protein